MPLAKRAWGVQNVRSDDRQRRQGERSVGVPMFHQIISRHAKPGVKVKVEPRPAPQHRVPKQVACHVSVVANLLILISPRLPQMVVCSVIPKVVALNAALNRQGGAICRSALRAKPNRVNNHGPNVMVRLHTSVSPPPLKETTTVPTISPDPLTESAELPSVSPLSPDGKPPLPRR